MNRKNNESKPVGISGDSCGDLAEMFEWMSSLCKVDCRYSSLVAIHLAWKRFWSEVARKIGRTAKAFNCEPVSEIGQPLESRPTLYSIGSVHRYSRSSFGFEKKVPIIRMSGLWLQDYGFHMHRKFKIYPERNQLILRLTNVIDTSGLPETFASCELGSEESNVLSVSGQSGKIGLV